MKKFLGISSQKYDPQQTSVIGKEFTVGRTKVTVEDIIAEGECGVSERLNSPMWIQRFLL